MSDSMVKSAADYEYVTGANVDDEHPHGDLDRIQIDGNIMPVRGDNAVRGEDIAFLMEFAMQRLKMIRKAIYADGGSYYSTQETECVMDWPFATALSCEFANKIDSAAFGDAGSGLFGLFSELASKVRFTSKIPELLYKTTPVVLNGYTFPKGILAYMVSPLSLDPQELTKAADLGSGSILKSSVEKYFSWLGSDKYLKNRYAFFYQYFTLLTGYYSGDYATYDLVVGTEGAYAGANSSSMRISAYRYCYDNKDVCELYCYPKEGSTLLTLICDHAISVCALIVLRCYITVDTWEGVDSEISYSTNYYDVVLRGDFEKTDDCTFVLKAKTMTSRDFMKELIKKCNANWYSQEANMEADMSVAAYVFPIIEFDSHTKY